MESDGVRSVRKVYGRPCLSGATDCTQAKGSCHLRRRNDDRIESQPPSRLELRGSAFRDSAATHVGM